MCGCVLYTVFGNIEVDLCERMVCDDCMILLKIELKAGDDDDDEYKPT